MQAVRLHASDGPSALRLEQIADPVPTGGQICVKVARAALNRRDLFITQGLYPGIDLPKTLGSDGCGTVASRGAGVHEPATGTAVVINPQLYWSENRHSGDGRGSVLGMPVDGTFAEYVVVPAENVFTKPVHLSDDEAAALPLAGLTAYRAVHTRGQIRSNDVVLIPGIGSGVQTFVLLYAKHAGATTIVTSSSDAKLARAKTLGADIAINYKTTADWHKAVRTQSPAQPSLIVDSTGGETLARCLEIARPGARVVIYGGTTGDATIRPFSIFWKHLTLLGTSMGSPDDFRAMLALVETAKLRPTIDRVFPLREAAAAFERLQHAEQFGKVVLAVA